MPSVNDLSESKYVQKKDIGDGLAVTITGYKFKDVSRESDAHKDEKYTLSFDECKPLVLNKTNGKRIAQIMHETYGITRDDQPDEDDPDKALIPANEQFRNWVGKRIVLWFNPDIEFQGEVTGGIRVRPPKPNPKTEPVKREIHYDENGEEIPF